ncbi:MAG: hypothetical protein PVH76_08255 [Myxococcales bacterium]|jgi:hypothetical protein
MTESKSTDETETKQNGIKLHKHESQPIVTVEVLARSITDLRLRLLDQSHDGMCTVIDFSDIKIEVNNDVGRLLLDQACPRCGATDLPLKARSALRWVAGHYRPENSAPSHVECVSCKHTERAGELFERLHGASAKKLDSCRFGFTRSRKPSSSPSIRAQAIGA